MKLTEAQKLRDKTGREIVPGDVLKVFHFVGARRKRYFMFKQVTGIILLGKEDPYPYFNISHLALNDEHYWERCDGRTLLDYEIVQSVDAKFADRPRRAALSDGGKHG